MQKLHSVITTIQPPTSAVLALVEKLCRVDSRLVVIGDRKGPERYEVSCGGEIDSPIDFYNLEAQKCLKFASSRLTPENHYARKNIGYLQAMFGGATSIYETDDDNAPMPDWSLREVQMLASRVDSPGWVNAYAYFTKERIWPRGFPLEELGTREIEAVAPVSSASPVVAPIQQGLANGSPDVDAIWRLLFDRPFEFEQTSSICLAPGSWCPFNSQSTWWFPEAYPLMYLPSYCSFRMTDIWRSFIAQRCLWELGHGVVFHAPEVHQERNFHDLMRDFADEVVGYQRNRELAQILEQLHLHSGAGYQSDNLQICYSALVKAGFFPQAELDLLRAWLADLKYLQEAIIGSSNARLHEASNH